MSEYLQFGENTNWIKAGDKQGGRKSAGQFGGLYQNNKEEKALIKRDTKNFANISEFLAGVFLKKSILIMRLKLL